MRAQSSLPVSSVYGFGVWGVARSHDQKVKLLPTLRGVPAQRPHQTHLPTSWAPMQRESRTVRPISLAFLGVQQTVGRQSTRATSRGSPCGKPVLAPSDGRLHALLNASAASESTAAGRLEAASSNASAASAAGESTTAGGLEAFSQSSAGTERIENASSKFRRNPSPLLPFTWTEKLACMKRLAPGVARMTL